MALASRHEASFAFTSDAEAALGTPGPAAGSDPIVNRAGKSDLLMSRIREPKAVRTIPASGTVWRLDDIFSAYEEADLPKVAFAAIGDAETLMAAYSAFRPLIAPGPILVAGGPIPRPGDDGPAAFAPGTWASPTLVAYAPEERGIEAPFDAVMNGQARVEEPETEVEPEPKPPTLLGWLKNRFRSRHAWADNPLPDSVFDDSEQDCLARAIYFEARGESQLGQAAVAQVVLNRVKNPTYPESVCGVVYQNQNWRGRCQFSFACDGIKDRIRSPFAWLRAKKIARDVTNGKVWLDEIADSTHYHADYVKPRWARAMKKVDTIGRHVFYRTYGGGWS
ncbi:cell wall hydrolase [Rhizobiales bacterium L72]|uniref:Cell wall hydrolase n=2 Tax=Propylenella binzhouense TaxID=2555902 RepID=A0A964T4G1_9HYPH|nr:cell wall hydrolase [Propylenella binzhouense]